VPYLVSRVDSVCDAIRHRGKPFLAQTRVLEKMRDDFAVLRQKEIKGHMSRVRSYLDFTDGLHTKGTRAHTYRELSRGCGG